MDISVLGGLSGSSYIKEQAEIGREDAKIGSFKSELEKAASSGDDLKLAQAAKEFEAYFINQLYKQMRSTINYTGGMFERSTAEVTFQEMLDEQYANIAAENSGIGLADVIYEQMKQETKGASPLS